VASSGTRVRYSYSGSGWSMQTIDPASSEPKRDARRLRPVALSVGAAVVCIAISLIILLLLLRQPERTTGLVSSSEAPTVSVQSRAALDLTIVPEAAAPDRELQAPDSIAPPATALGSESDDQGSMLGSESDDQGRMLGSMPYQSGEVGDATSPPPSAGVVEPRQTKSGSSNPADTKATSLDRRPSQTVRGTTGKVAQMVLAFATARPADGDPITSPVVLKTGQEKRVMLYTELRDLAGQTISHRWQHAGRTVAVIPFEVKGDRWRVHSTKRVTADLKGDWQVLVVDGRGATLASRSFAVR
jgi:DUF2914 family protein